MTGLVGGPGGLGGHCKQSHYREVPWWEIFMEHELRFGLDLGGLAVLKERFWANYEQLSRGKKNV